MRILYSFPCPIGAPGIGATALRGVLGLLDRGHDVTVITTSGHRAPTSLPKLIETMSIGMRMPDRVLGMDAALDYHDACVARHLKRRRHEYDVVHCWPGATLNTARMAAELGVPSLRETPATHTENACEIVGQLFEDLDLALPRRSSYRLKPSRLARECAEYESAFRLLVPSDSVAKTFRTRGFPAEKVLRHRYGFDPANFSPPVERPPGPLRAMFVGEIAPHDGLHVALDAWAKSKASKAGRFTIYGRVADGYRPIIAPYLTTPGVEMHEFTSDVNDAFRASDVLLLPSFEDGGALVAFEAQGCGLIPLASTASGAMCVDGITGFVHPTGDVSTLTAHLDQLSDDPKRREQMHRAVLVIRETLTWAAAAECLETCYESAISAAQSLIMANRRESARAIQSAPLSRQDQNI